MRGFDALQSAKVREQEVQKKLITVARSAAKVVADLVSDELESSKFPRKYRIVKTANGYLLKSDDVESLNWEYNAAKAFAKDVNDGLLEDFAEIVNRRTEELAKFMGEMA